jgi:hypothetical protein
VLTCVRRKPLRLKTGLRRQSLILRGDYFRSSLLRHLGLSLKLAKVAARRGVKRADVP